MSKKILKVVGVVALGAAALVTGVGLAAGLSLSTIGGLTVSVAGISLGVSVGALAGIGLVGLSLARSLSRPTFEALSDYARTFQMQTSPDWPRYLHYGQTASAGRVVYQEFQGSDNKTMWIVLQVSGTEVDSIVSMKLNDKTITLPTISLPGTPGGAVASGNFSGKLEVYWHDGRDSSNPFPALTTASSTWASQTRKLRGIPCVCMKATLDEDFDGRFEPRFVFKGRKLYDPRLDSTNGGSGSHRLDDATTWEWSENPALAWADYVKGVTVNSILVAGLDKEDRIDWSLVISAANICEESVSLAAGGSEDRYKITGAINPRSAHRQNIELIVLTMAGQYAYVQGKYLVYAGAYRTPASTTIAAENMIGVPSSYREYTGIDERINQITGQFVDASNDYLIQSYPTVSDSTAQATEGERSVELHLPNTPSATMAQRIATIKLRRSQKMKRLEAQFNHKMLPFQPGDVVQVTYARYGLSNQVMMIDRWESSFIQDGRGNIGIGVKLGLIEEDSSIYDWSTSDEQTTVVSATTTWFNLNGFYNSGNLQYIGSGGRIVDDLFINNSALGGAEFVETGTSLTSVDAGATATINIAAFTRNFAGASVSYNSGSITGLSYSTTYYIYASDPNRAGGAVTYQASTTATDAMSSADNIYLGTVTTVVSGATGGTGSSSNPWCVGTDMYLMNGIKAGDAVEGSPIDILEPGGFRRTKVQSAETVVTECVEVEMQGGAKLICSALTPITQKDGSCIYARFSEAKQAACDDRGIFGWQHIVAVREIGMKPVARIHVGGETYAAGADPDRRVFTHNPVKA